MRVSSTVLPPLLSLLTCVILLDPNSTLASTPHQWGTCSSQTPGSQVCPQQEKTCPASASRAPEVPPSKPAIPVQGHPSAVLQGQEHHRGWGFYGRCSKIEVQLQWGEDSGDLARAGWSRETGSETGMRTG